MRNKMTERSLTPSPNRSQNLERGVFSSLSTVSLFKQPIEERKFAQPSSTGKKTQKSRSPTRIGPVVKKIEKSPESLIRSPLKIQNRGKEETEMKNDAETNKLLESLKNANLQFAREKRINSKLENEIKELKNSHKSEINALILNIEKIQKSMQGLMGNYNGLSNEKEKITEENKKIKEKYEEIKDQLKNVIGILITILTLFFSSFEENDSLISQEKLRIGSKIKDLVTQKLKEIMESNNIDLNRQLNEIRGWMILNNFPRQSELNKLNCAKEKTKFSAEEGKNFEKLKIYNALTQDDKIINEKNTKSKIKAPEISYVVEYFEDDPFITESVNRLKFSSHESTEKLNDDKNPHKFAIALYDFEGERSDDLSFFSGDTIEILNECESGWWVGHLNGRTGTFPYNFVQIINI